MKVSNKIPTISSDRLDDSVIKPLNNQSTKEELNIRAFLKGKESVQAISARLPKVLYKKLRKIAFDEEKKINSIIVSVLSKYIEKFESENGLIKVSKK